MTTQKSRKNPRAQVTLVARYRSPTAFEYVEEHCFDLSSGGMFIESNAPAPAGTLIKLECDVNDGAGTLKGVARVVWLREQESNGQPKGMGVKFLKLEPGGRELILQLLGERASLPPTDSIPPSRRSWSPSSVAPSPRSSGAPAASSSQAPAVQRPSLTAASPAEPVAEHQEVDPSELSVVAGPGVSEATEAAATSAFAAIAAPSAAAPSAQPEGLTAGSELISGAVSVEAAASAVMAVDGQLHEPAGTGHAAEHAASVDAADAGQAANDSAAAGHGAEHGGATPHQDHRPHAHELRERLARRAAAQRAAAANAALAAARAAHFEAPSAEAASEPSSLHATATAAAESGAGATGEAAGWQEPARAPEPAPAAAPASARPAARGGAAAEGAAAARPVSDERREFTLKGDVPVEEMPQRRGAIYLGLIAAGVALILLLQLRKGDEPEPAAAVEAPSPPAAPVEPAAAPVAAPEPAPPPPVEPAQTYVVELSTTPEGATVELGGQSTTTPAQLALGTLAAPVTVSVRKDGFEPASLEIDQTGFVLEGGQLRRRIQLSLSALPPPPPAPPVVAVKKPEPAPEPRAAKKPAAERAPRERPAPATASAKPTPEPAPKPAPKPAPEPPAASEPAPAAAQSPLQAAMACLSTGDNPCVLRALEGKASGPRELELLIETHRAMGNAGKAEQLMQGYVEKFPGERRATTYRRQLDRKAAESGAGDTATPAP